MKGLILAALLASAAPSPQAIVTEPVVSPEFARLRDEFFVARREAYCRRLGYMAPAFRELTPAEQTQVRHETIHFQRSEDLDGDGRINWRDDREFTPTAEKTARTIYER